MVTENKRLRKLRKSRVRGIMVLKKKKKKGGGGGRDVRAIILLRLLQNKGKKKE